jgi:hypothetical protein
MEQKLDRVWVRKLDIEWDTLLGREMGVGLGNQLENPLDRELDMVWDDEKVAGKDKGMDDRWGNLKDNLLDTELVLKLDKGSVWGMGD